MYEGEMNRHARRKLQATVSKSEYDTMMKMQRLQAENDQLRVDNVKLRTRIAQLDNQTEGTGKPTLGQLVKLQTGVDLAYKDGFKQALQLTDDLKRAVDLLKLRTVAICHIAACSNGPATRHTMQTVSSTLMTTLENLDTEIKKLEAKKHPLIEIDYAKIYPAIDQFKGLRDHVKRYLIEETDSAQERLRLYAEGHGNEGLRELYAELKNIAKRGAGRKKVDTEIGTMAARYPDPGRGKMYRVGLDILDDLRKIEPRVRTDTQRECIVELEGLSKADKWRDLGTYIARVRKSNMSIESRK